MQSPRLHALKPWARRWSVARANPWLTAARFLWIAAALAILGWGAALRLAWPLEPLADADYYGYLNPALSKLTGGGFEHSIGREFLYPASVFLELCLFGDFRAISVCQHILGLLTGALLLLAWQELLALRRAPFAAAEDARTLLFAVWRQAPAFLLTAVYLCQLPTLLSEHSIRPEAIFPFFAAGGIWLNLRFIRLVWIENRLPAAWKIGALHLFVTGVWLLLRPSCAFAAPLINLPLAVALWTRPAPWREKLRPLGVAALLAALLLFLPESLLRRGDRNAVILFPAMRLLVHAPLVLRQLDDDLASSRPTRYDRAMLQAFRARLAHAVDESRRPENHPWPKLGFNPDFIYLHEAVFEPFFPVEDPTKDRALAAFCNHYCVRMALRHPFGMAGKIAEQLTFLYHFKPQLLRRQRAEPLRFNAKTLYAGALRDFAYPPFQRLMGLSYMGPEYLQRCERLARSRRVVPQSRAIDRADLLLSIVYLPVLLPALAACGWVLGNRARRETLGVPAWTTLLLYAYNFGVSLTIASVFYLGQERYLHMQKTFTLFSEFAALYFLGCCCAAAAGRRPASAPPMTQEETGPPPSSSSSSSSEMGQPASV